MDNMSERSINRIVEGTSFVGNIHCESNIRIDGKFEGELTTTGRLVVGATGRVNGQIKCTACEVEGKVEGLLQVQDLLALKSASKVHGDIYYGQLSVESGAEATGALHLISNIKEMRLTETQENKGNSSTRNNTSEAVVS